MLLCLAVFDDFVSGVDRSVWVSFAAQMLQILPPVRWSYHQFSVLGAQRKGAAAVRHTDGSE